MLQLNLPNGEAELVSFEPRNGEKYALGVQKKVQIHSSENGKVERTLDHDGRVQTLGFFSVSTIINILWAVDLSSFRYCASVCIEPTFVMCISDLPNFCSRTNFLEEKFNAWLIL